MSASTIRKLEDLPSDGGRAVDTLAGAMLRLFVKLHALEEAQARLGRRIAALEGAPASVVPISVPAPAAIPSPAPAPRKRGRPSGSLRRPGNGYSIEPRT
jgi:hypothetical protein